MEYIQSEKKFRTARNSLETRERENKRQKVKDKNILCKH